MLGELHKNGVTHIVWLPDTETSFLYAEVEADPELSIVPVCREAESMAVAAGLWIGGKRPVVMIQNTGLLESGDSVRGLTVDVGLPLVMMIGYRGWTRHGETTDSAALITEPTLRAWRLNYYLVETDADAGRISEAFEEAGREQHPVACLIGAEYG
jgi:sulfopyruvate decarboxylase subunit alpha